MSLKLRQKKTDHGSAFSKRPISTKLCHIVPCALERRGRAQRLFAYDKKRPVHQGPVEVKAEKRFLYLFHKIAPSICHCAVRGHTISATLAERILPRARCLRSGRKNLRRKNLASHTEADAKLQVPMHASSCFKAVAAYAAQWSACLADRLKMLYRQKAVGTRLHFS